MVCRQGHGEREEGTHVRCFLISACPFASLLVEQVVSMGTGLVDDTQPASEGAPGLASLPSVPSKGSSQCQALHTYPIVLRGMGLAAGKTLLRRDKST